MADNSCRMNEQVRPQSSGQRPLRGSQGVRATQNTVARNELQVQQQHEESAYLRYLRSVLAAMERREPLPDEPGSTPTVRDTEPADAVRGAGMDRSRLSRAEREAIRHERRRLEEILDAQTIELRANVNAYAALEAMERPEMRIVSHLPQRIIRKSDKENIDSDCPICFNAYEIGMMLIQLPCGHKLHTDCIAHWLHQTNSCPMCRAALPKKDEVNDDEQIAGEDPTAQQLLTMGSGGH